MVDPVPADRRPFTLLDVMILVAGCALGFTALTGVGVARLPAWERVLAMATAVAGGVLLVGPLIVWRGWRLTGRRRLATGEWVWLVNWPVGLLLWASSVPVAPLAPGSIALSGAVVAQAGLLTFVLLSVLVLRKTPIGEMLADGACAPADAPWPRSPDDVALWAGLTALTSLCAALPMFWVGPQSVALALANATVSTAVRAQYQRQARPQSGPPAPWPHRAGVAAVCLPPALLVISLLGDLARAL